MTDTPNASAQPQTDDKTTVIKLPKPNGQNESGPERPATIPDPGNDPPSKYTSAPNFAGRQGLKRRTTILLKRPKNYCKSRYTMAQRQGMVTLIDASRADAIERDLHLIEPRIANDDELMRDVVGAYEVLLVPFLDRHSIPHLWPIRQCSTDGRELPGFASAVEAAEFAEDRWSLITWMAGAWEYEEHKKPGAIHAEWPKALITYDDWIENGFPGRIIRDANHDILEAARGKR